MLPSPPEGEASILARELISPVHMTLPVGGDSGESLVFELAIQSVQVAVVVERGWDIGGDFLILALPEKLAGLHVNPIDRAFFGADAKATPLPAKGQGTRRQWPIFPGFQVPQR